jgi:iron complex transport system substrate-binding protein
MSRYRVLVAHVVVLAALLAACDNGSVPRTAEDARPSSPAASVSAASSPASPAASAFPLTITDDEGVTVTLPAAPQRIVTFAPANTEILFALGLGDRVVGVSGSFDDFPPAARKVEEVGGQSGVEPNEEKVVSLEPDLLLATSGGEEWKKRLRDLGVPVFTVDATTLDDVFHDIRTIGRLTGVPDRARSLTDRLSARAREIERTVRAEPPVTCFYEVYFQPPVYTVGPGSFVFDLLRDAGCNPVTSGLKNPYPALSVEALVHDDPDVYLVDSLSAPSVAAVGKRAGYDALRAVRRDRVAIVDSDPVTRPGPRVVQGLEELARALHPDAFA